MKKSPVKKLIALMLVVVMAAALLPVGSEALSGIFVNSANTTLSGTLSGSYAVGSGGKSVIGTSSPYVMTASGLTTIGGSSGGSNPGTASTVIDKSKYTDGSRYNNPAVNISKVRVGLFYGSSALTQAKLLNEVGSGYKFGYFDSSRTFHEVGYTTEKALTMIKDTNVPVDGVGTIGCYHIKLNTSYSDFNSAQTAASAYADGFPAYYNGTYYVLRGNYTTQQAAAAAIASSGVSGTAFSASNRCVVVTKSDTNKILFEYDGGTSTTLAIEPQSSSGKAQTWFKGYKYYGAFQYDRRDGGNLTVSNFVDLEDYVKGVIPYEMTPSWPVEALKAQALCARTYVATNMNSYSKYGFDVTNDTYSQVYRGTSGANSRSDQAVDETAGLFVRYQGKLCSTFYFSSDGGSTEDSGNVFQNSYPYLAGVIDPFEEAASFNYKTWSYTFTGAELSSKLVKKGYNIGTVTNVTPTYSPTGNCIKISFSDANGRAVTLTKTNAYNGIGLPSCHFTVTGSGGSFVFDGGGWGHNCGMSQWGAYSMAKNYGYTADDIIRFYFTGAYIA